jgi:hypothetical protein
MCAVRVPCAVSQPVLQGARDTCTRRSETRLHTQHTNPHITPCLLPVSFNRYTFGEGGIFSTMPLTVPNHRETIDMGYFRGTPNQVSGVVARLRGSFVGGEYDLVRLNCNSFSTAFVTELLGHPPPAYVRRVHGHSMNSSVYARISVSVAKYARSPQDAEN